MPHKRRMTAPPPDSGHSKRQSTDFALSLYSIPNPPTCQAIEQLTPARRLFFAKIAQDLGTFYFSQVLAVIDEPDPIFNRPFSRFALCVKIVEAHLKEVRL